MLYAELIHRREKVLEGMVVIFVKYHTNERIKGRVAVAKPNKDAF